jgi:hypothetical protein
MSDSLNTPANLGDVSTLADPAVVEGLIRERQAASLTS